MLLNFWIYNRLLYSISIPYLLLMIVTGSECQFQWYMTMDSVVLNINHYKKLGINMTVKE